jgi:hypothetical protein
MHPYAMRTWPHNYEAVVDTLEALANMEVF